MRVCVGAVTGGAVGLTSAEGVVEILLAGGSRNRWGLRSEVWFSAGGSRSKSIDTVVCGGDWYWAISSPTAGRRTGISSSVGMLPDPKSCKTPSVASMIVSFSGFFERSEKTKAGWEGIKPFEVGSTFATCPRFAKWAVSVLALDEGAWVMRGPLLRLCVERADIKEGGDCGVGLEPLFACRPVFASLSLTVGLMGTSLRPLEGRDGQRSTDCLLGSGDGVTGGSRWSK